MGKCTLQHWYLPTRLNGVTSQKALTLIVTSEITKKLKISQYSVHVSNQTSLKSYAAMRSYPGYRYFTYRVIHKFLRDFRTRLRNSQDRHGRKEEHINRYKISPSFFFVLGALAYFQVPPLGVVVKKNGVHSE